MKSKKRVDILEFPGLEEIANHAAELQELRLEEFRRRVKLCALADAMGPAARSYLAYMFNWSTHTVNQLASLISVPEELWTPEIPLGIYWFVRDFPAPEREDILREAIVNSYSLADVKKKLGFEYKRTGGKVYRANVVDHRGRTVILEGDELALAGEQLGGSEVAIRKINM